MLGITLDSEDKLEKQICLCPQKDKNKKKIIQILLIF